MQGSATHPCLMSVRDLLPPSSDQFREDVLHGLRLPEKELPCKYFYDARGSQLFEQICDLDEYYLTRTELAIMDRHAGEMADVFGRKCLLIEYGSGSSIKTRLLLDHLKEPVAYVPIDISREHLTESALNLAEQYPQLKIMPLCADFANLPSLPANGKSARKAVYFPGSTIGNFTRDEAIGLLRQTARLCGLGGRLLLGADLKKDPRVLEAAYNDDKGVTAAFNLNLLVRINRELEGDFPIDRFWHHAFYNPTQGRIEIYLISQVAQRVRVAGEVFQFSEGEPIRTEYSYKYSIDGLREMAAAAGFEVKHGWTDDRNNFLVLYLAVRF
ncbi:MAG TPA: L-histidine N(alpha)-methyltransferase [Gemmataceae bacterium]|nr:L-histidine N(alpha)-methyltransferase [Gemmataceae bacterium]